MGEASHDPHDRRPIKTRELKLSARAAGWLVARGVSANTVSVLGMVAGIASGLALAGTAHAEDHARWLWFAGAALVQIRLLANMLDGMVAIASGEASAVGELYNEVPDRVSDTATLVGLGYALGGHVALGYAAALGAMFTAYVRAVGKGAGAPNDFGGPQAKPQRMFLVTLLALWLAFTPAAWQPIWSGFPCGLPALLLLLILAGTVWTASARLARIAARLRNR